MIKAFILTPLVMLLVLLPASAQQDMDDVMAQMESANEAAPMEEASVEASVEQTEVDRLNAILQKGIDHYNRGDFHTSIMIFDAVLAIDKYNADAMVYKKRAFTKISKKADAQRESTRAEALSDVQALWNTEPLVYGKMDETEAAAAPEDSGPQDSELMEARLKAIKIPVFDMAEATIQDVVRFFAESSRNQAGGGEDVDILLVGMEEASAENNITISVDNINLYEALQYVVEMASLKFEIKQNLVIIMPANYVPATRMVMRSFNVVPEVGEDLVSVSDDSGGASDLFDASAADASSSGPVDVSGFFSLVDFPEGSSAVYQARFQKLFVKNTPANLKAVEAVLNDLTEKAIQSRSQQVAIEAKFVEFNEGALSEIGFDWTVYGNGSVLGMQMDDGRYFHNRNGYRSPLPPEPPPPDGSGDPGEPQLTLPPQNTLYYNPVTGAKEIDSPNRRAQNFFAAHQRNNTTAFDSVDIGILSTMGGVPAEMIFGNDDVDLRITAMQQEGTADVLSAPRVTTKSGAEAFIRVAETHRYPQDWEPETGQSAAPIIRPQDWTDFDLGVSLTVTPVADAENGTIELDLLPELLVFKGFDLYRTGLSVHDEGGNLATDIIGGGQNLFAQMVAVERRNVQTQAVVADGSTVVMGGLVSERTETFRDQVPFIGDIPYLGRLFRSEGSRTAKRNLTIFVKATMVDTRGMTSADRELARR